MRRRTISQRLAGLALAVALASVPAACGARLTDEQRAAALGGSAPVAGQQATGDAAQAVAPGTLEAGPTTTVAAAAPGDQPATPAAPVPGQPQAAGACRPQGGGEKGVTPTEVTIGNVSTISGPVPGLGQTMQNGVEAYVNFVNSKGGVCGRKLELIPTDDRLDSGTNRAETQRLMDQAIALVGGFSVVDDGGASVLQGTNVPDVGLAINDNRITLPNNFSPGPIDPGARGNGTEPMQRWFKEQMGVTKAAIVYPAQAAARKRGLAYGDDIRAAGIEVVVEAEVAVTQTDYTGVATQIKNAGADMVITALEIGGAARLAQALEQQGHELKVGYWGAQAYGRKFIQQAGPAAEGTVIGVQYATLEDAATNPAVADFQQWYARTNPGADPDYFAILGWASAALFVQALEQAGPTPTRDLVLQALRTMTDVDAGGMIAPRTNPAGKKPSPCFAVIAVEGGKWVKKHPAKGFQC